MLKIHEVTTESGGLEPVCVSADEGTLVVWVGSEGRALPAGALGAVMARFGGPLDPNVRLLPVGSLDLGSGGTLRHVRHLAHYDVIARDFLVLERPGAEPLCALSTTVAGALEHLARAHAAT